MKLYDVVIIGAGAAGLMAAVWAGRTYPRQRILVLDGARKLGAKILVAGGGRCNVTHRQVSERDYAGSTPPAIRHILRRFDVPETIRFFGELGVPLKEEETGKLFPTTDSSRTVLEALLAAVRRTGAEIRHPARVEQVARLADGAGFVVGGAWGEVRSRQLVLATGGRSLPKSGSDGLGYTFATQLGHSLTPHITPALVPLTLPPDHFLCGLSGLAAPATLTVQGGTGKRLAAFTNAVLCTHFGLSGPAVLDVSRHWLAARTADPHVQLLLNWWPEGDLAALLLADGRQTPLQRLRERLPERLARALCDEAGVTAGLPAKHLPRAQRQALVQLATAYPLPITGDRGYTYAEVTAGGVPLRELHLKTLESRLCPGLHLCGEICDVDGRIGGFNFQWAWASGFVVGTGLAEG